MPVVVVLCAVAVAAALLWPQPAYAQSCSSGSDTSIDQHGVTITFGQSYTCGTFANGDYWVVPATPGGAVTIDAMTPAFNGTEHGWEVNPTSVTDQGFDSRAHNFDAGRVPSLPYLAEGGQSIVKAISVDSADVNCRPCLDTAVVLTVLDTAPPSDGTTSFRPPYFGANKPLIDVSALRPERLPTLASPGGEPSLTDLATRYSRVQLDHQSNWIGRAIHPVQNMPDYGASIGRDSGDAVLGLMLDDTEQDKMPALVNFVQFGIDLYYMMQGGQTWPANGGHHNGRKIAMIFAAVLLDDAAMQADVLGASDSTFGEDGIIVYSDVAQRVLWGQECSEQDYWQNQTDQSGSRTCRDPYGHIDGGETPGGSYQHCCNSGMWKGTALALYLMDELRCLWNNEHFLHYVDRWVEHGAWSQPDPCAPSDGNWSNYGVTFGPDGSSGCIPDTEPTCTAEELAAGATDPCTGRWPARHGAAADDGHYTSPFAYAMWDAYRSQGSTDPPNCDGTGGAGAAGGGGGTGGAGGTTGGTGGVGGTTPGAAATPDDDSGCGCRLPRTPRGSHGPASWLLILSGAWLLRRRCQVFRV